MFDKLDTEGLEEEQDRLGGYSLLETDVYDGVIKLAYVIPSTKSDSKCIVTVVDYGGHEMTERNWFLTGKGDPFYEKNGKKHMLPGFETVNSLCLMATGSPLSEQEVEDKTIDLWDKDAQAEKPKNVPVITSLLKQPITAAITKEIVNKQEDDGSGEWVDINEEREQNVTDKYFNTERRVTVAEAKRMMKEPDLEIPEEELFMTLWLEKNKGVTRNKYKEVAGGNKGGGSKGTGSPNKPKAKKKLFG